MDKTKWTLDEWFKESQQGLRCGILGCPTKPVAECPQCHAWYCDKHKNIHFHLKEKVV
ncbi:unnamed protein product [marine sediment metagenome]|uniref:Uncharacterized protein n=1 Tax=marine sediment metagenome TaxID=412755 RepID=X1RH86_9ZZZZ